MCWLRTLPLVIMVAASLLSRQAHAVGPEAHAARHEALSGQVVQAVMPGATRVGAWEGSPPAAPVFRDGRQIGYLLSTKDVVGAAGFSGKVFDILVGLDLDGRLTGARILEHDEPILIIGVTEKRLADFVAQYRGIDIRMPVRLGDIPTKGAPVIDGIAGATISSVVMNDAILRAARMVARARGILAPAPGEQARLDIDSFTPADWSQLIKRGAIAALHVRNGDLARAFRDAGLGDIRTGPPDDRFIDLYVALATPATIGRNLLGARAYNRAMADLGAGDQLLVVAGAGLYSFKGTRYVRSGVFDRIALVQGERTIRLKKAWHKRFESLAIAGAPSLREIALFTIPKATGFDPVSPWRLQLVVGRETTAGETAYLDLGLDYRIPREFVLAAETDASAPPRPLGERPLWTTVWTSRVVRISVLVVALAVLTALLFFQDLVVRRPRLHSWLRIGFLSFTLVWLGWYAGAQLSVLNVFTFTHSLLSGFRWEFFLLEPLTFILWSYVALAMLFWGRGVFCGWLCPFGALQELLNKAAQALRVPQVKIPFVVHERLWTIKYVVFLGLMAVSLHSLEWAVRGSEIEPFKTAITLIFRRAAPFVAYVAILLAIGLVIERFFCRYLCPLGAALAIPARLRMFEWLKRRRQCGNNCHICAEECTVQAIHPGGAINPNECIYCLDCQVTYYDDRKCPPLVTRRKRLGLDGAS